MILERAEKVKQTVMVTVEGERYALHPLIWSQYAVFPGEEFDLESLLSLSRREWSLEAGLRYAGYSMRTRSQVRDHLYKKELDGGEEILDKLEEWGAINDYEYAMSYARSLERKNGPYHIRSKLREKGISSEIISEIDLYEDPEVITEILEKKYVDWQDISPKEAMKRQKFLVGRGFSFESARKAVESMKNREE